LLLQQSQQGSLSIIHQDTPQGTEHMCKGITVPIQTEISTTIGRREVTIIPTPVRQALEILTTIPVMDTVGSVVARAGQTPTAISTADD
jgi:hypothetical protein